MLIDFHVHVFPDKLAAGAVSSLAERAHIEPHTDGTLQDTLSLMQKDGVDRFVLLNIAVTPRTERHVNDFAVSLQSISGAIPFGSVHPDSPNALSELKRLREAGIRGIKFHNEYQNFYVDDERAYPIYNKCAEYGMVMLFHGGADWGFAPPVKAAPNRMRKVADDFPQAKIVVAHLGGQDMADEAIRFLADSSVWIDTSFTARSVSVETTERVIRAFGPERVLFGTDCPWDTPADTVRHLKKTNLSNAELDQIFSSNAIRLLDMN